jgi:hypothetical protein
MSILWVSSKEKCISRMESCFDSAVVAIGPLLILLASFLIGSAGWLYFRWILTHFHYPDPATRGIVFYILAFNALYLLICIFFHYIMAIIIKPGNVTEQDALRWSRIQEAVQQHSLESANQRTEIGTYSTEHDLLQTYSKEDLRRVGMGPMRMCKHCKLPKPARTHHCSVCQKCVFKMDHHCPWIAGCVGHHNHRHFVLFLLYMSFGCYYFAIMTFPAFLSAVRTPVLDTQVWPQPLVRSLLALLWILAVVIGIAIVGLTWWQWFLVKNSYTTIDYYKAMDEQEAHKKQNLPWSNKYDLGYAQNIRFFFSMNKR